MSASEYGTEAHVVSTTSRTMVLDGEFDGNDQLTYRPDRKVILVESGAIEELETELAEVDENARESGAIAERARQRLADVEQERDALRERNEKAAQLVADFLIGDDAGLTAIGRGILAALKGGE
jgi:hypothetical protein